MNHSYIYEDNHADRYVARIENHLTGSVIPLVVMPKGITETTNANFAQQSIVGASVPRIVYSSTSAKTMSLDMENLTEDYIPEGYSSLLEYVRTFQALVYPTYEGDIVNSPDLTLYLGDRRMSCVCTNVSVTWR